MTKEDVIVIKKYSNRRLYNVESSSYVTLMDLSDLIKQGREFIVVDAKTSEDITRLILSQIIFEHQQNGYEMMPNEMLVQLIRWHNHPTSQMFLQFLKQIMAWFNSQQQNHNNSHAMWQNMQNMWQMNQKLFASWLNNNQGK